MNFDSEETEAYFKEKTKGSRLFHISTPKHACLTKDDIDALFALIDKHKQSLMTPVEKSKKTASLN